MLKKIVQGKNIFWTLTLSESIQNYKKNYLSKKIIKSKLLKKNSAHPLICLTHFVNPTFFRFEVMSQVGVNFKNFF